MQNQSSHQEMNASGKNPPAGNSRRWLYTILAASLVLRLGLWVGGVTQDVNRFYWADTKGYQDSALALLELGKYVISLDQPLTQTFRLPGYPLFLAAVYRIFGVWPPGVVLIQIFISLGSIWLVYRLGRRLWNEKAGLWAAGILALDPVSLTYSLKVLTETLFTFLVLVAVSLVLWIFNDSRRARWAFLPGVALAAATFVKPNTLYLVWPLGLGFLAWAASRRWGWKPVATLLLLFALPQVLAVGAWRQRNERLTGSSVFSSVEGFNLYFRHVAGMMAIREGISWEEAQIRLGSIGRETRDGDRVAGYVQLHPEVAGLSFEQISEVWSREAREYIRQHPLLFVRVHVDGIIKTLLKPGTAQLYGLLGGREDLPFLSPREWARRPVMALTVLYTVVYVLALYGLVLRGVWISRKTGSPSWPHLFIAGLLIYFAAVAGGPPVWPLPSRHRVVIMPLLALLAARGLVRVSPGDRNSTPVEA
ncbi:MAG: phospholipid carrier-dependent glycosyltransferase [Candidatus Zixiibacteriota bacterium]|nr:MAG: phospholipid carrier-dependent glycosyltransferase [candidate division Zixibacteria bacterium]